MVSREQGKDEQENEKIMALYSRGVVILKNENLASQQGANCSSKKSKTYLEKVFRSILKSPPPLNLYFDSKVDLNFLNIFFILKIFF